MGNCCLGSVGSAVFSFVEIALKYPRRLNEKSRKDFLISVSQGIVDSRNAESIYSLTVWYFPDFILIAPAYTLGER